MPVALWYGVTTLLWKHRHQLLERTAWFAKGEVDLDSVAVDQIRSEGRVVEGIIPVPAHTALVVVVIYPLQTFNI